MQMSDANNGGAAPAVDPGVGIYAGDVHAGRAIGGAMKLRDIANVQPAPRDGSA
jgi:hypothetical protein